MSPLKPDGGAAGTAGGTGGTTHGSAGSAGSSGSPGTAGTSGLGGSGRAGGTGGSQSIGYCDTDTDCVFHRSCCGEACTAKTDPSAPLMVCNVDCEFGPGAATCGCVDHQCSTASSCVVPRSGLCPYCPNGYLTGPGGCQTCQCKPGDAGTDTSSSGDGSTEALPACAWPASVNGHDAGAGACRAARTFLSCTAPNGVGEECTSDDPTQCSGGNGMPGVTFTCHDLCGPEEYGAACGSIGPGPISDPPAGCHGAEATPAGVVFYCCPCL